MPEVVVIGSVMLDKVSRVERLPRPGENVFAFAKHTYLGGKGFNQALAAHRFGAEVKLIGCLGDDEGWELFHDFMTKEGMDTGGLKRTDKAATGQADIWVQADGLNMICAYPGANDHLLPEMFMTGDNGRYDILTHGTALAQLEVPDCAARMIGASGTTILNPAPMRDFDRTMLAGLDFLTPNESETLALTGVDPVDEASCARAGHMLIDEGVETVIITLGARGCFLVSNVREIHLAAPQVTAVDTTAAGDVFNGVLAATLQGNEIEFAVSHALAAASLSTTRPGAAPSVPTRAEVEAFMNAY